jgi:hypothetical protein
MEDEFSARWKSKRAALIIAHPGHELRVHHWLEQAKPLVYILTDGSGHTNSSRIRSTTRLIEKAGATPARVYGRLTDKQLYAAILSRDHQLFRRLVDEIAESLEYEGIEYVAGDAVEGFNPGHDVCRLLSNSALLRLNSASNRRLRNLEFPLEGRPYDCPSADLAEAIVLKLDEEAFHRKVEATLGYAELAVDIDRTLANSALEAFRIECLRPVRYGLDISDCFQHPATYERYGEERVTAGYYREPIRFRDHVEPVARGLAT